ncbi:MAG: hypothetical protein FJ135_00475 [Deltaproteobacteria bacterium]|nr:hypothetical protein [Deltaproteobacteria bacterium]
MKASLLRMSIVWLVVVLSAVLLASGCTTVKKWTGLTTPDDEEVAREAKEAMHPQVGETVVIDGKTYVRSRNPYYLTYPEEPEYIYAEPGKEFTGLGGTMAKLREKYFGREEKAAAGVPPEKVQELVRQEVERILREQGRGGELYLSQVKSTSPYSGRALAVIPALQETPRGYDGLNLSLANGLRAELQRQKDLVVIPEAASKEALLKLTGRKFTSRQNIQALGDALGVQGIIVTQVIPPGQKDSFGYLVMEVYETFNGAQVKTVLEPFDSAALRTDAAQTAIRKNATLLANEVRGLDWFGRIEFLKGEKVFLNVGNNTGLKPGKLLQVVEPGKEVINPNNQAILGYTADVPRGELRVTDVLGTNAAAAVVVSGGPFQPNEKIKAR